MASSAVRGWLYYLAAVTMISTRVSGVPSRASTQARTGFPSGSTQAFHAASIWSFSRMSVSQTCAHRIFDLSLPAAARAASIFLRTSSDCALQGALRLSAVVPAT